MHAKSLYLRIQIHCNSRGDTIQEVLTSVASDRDQLIQWNQSSDCELERKRDQDKLDWDTGWVKWKGDSRLGDEIGSIRIQLELATTRHTFFWNFNVVKKDARLDSVIIFLRLLLSDVYFLADVFSSERFGTAAESRPAVKRAVRDQQSCQFWMLESDETEGTVDYFCCPFNERDVHMRRWRSVQLTGKTWTTAKREAATAAVSESVCASQQHLRLPPGKQDQVRRHLEDTNMTDTVWHVRGGWNVTAASGWVVIRSSDRCISGTRLTIAASPSGPSIREGYFFHADCDIVVARPSRSTWDFTRGREQCCCNREKGCAAVFQLLQNSKQRTACSPHGHPLWLLWRFIPCLGSVDRCHHTAC